MNECNPEHCALFVGPCPAAPFAVSQLPQAPTSRRVSWSESLTVFSSPRQQGVRCGRRADRQQPIRKVRPPARYFAYCIQCRRNPVSSAFQRRLVKARWLGCMPGHALLYVSMNCSAHARGSSTGKRDGAGQGTHQSFPRCSCLTYAAAGREPDCKLGLSTASHAGRNPDQPRLGWISGVERQTEACTTRPG